MAEQKAAKKRTRSLAVKRVETEGGRKEATGFDYEQALQAIKAIQEYSSQKAVKSAESGKVDLFGDDRSIYLDVVMKKYPIHIPAVKFIEVFLPHPFHDPQTASSCIIVRDLDKYPRRTPDREKSQRLYKQFFDEVQNLTEFTQVLSVSQLLTDYKTYEARRKLCQSFDVIIADKRLKGQITKWLGKEFVLSKKIPFLINVTKNVKRGFQHVFEMSRAILTPNTLKFSVKIGRLNQPADQLLENLKAITTRLACRMPGKWDNVRSAYVSVPAFLELPVYVDWGSSNAIKFPKRVKRKTAFVEDELTTLLADDDEPTPKVRVYENGKIRFTKRVKKVKKEKAPLNDTSVTEVKDEK